MPYIKTITTDDGREIVDAYIVADQWHIEGGGTASVRIRAFESENDLVQNKTHIIQHRYIFSYDTENSDLIAEAEAFLLNQPFLAGAVIL